MLPISLILFWVTLPFFAQWTKSRTSFQEPWSEDLEVLYLKFLADLIIRVYYEFILRWALIAGTLLFTLFLTTFLVFDVSSLTDIQNARGLIEVLSEMLSALTPQDRMVCFLSPAFLSLATMCSFWYLLISIVEMRSQNSFILIWLIFCMVIEFGQRSTLFNVLLQAFWNMYIFHVL